jgi:hypothetical protein
MGGSGAYCRQEKQLKLHYRQKKEVVAMLKVSKHDKNLLALLYMAEIIGKSLIKMCDDGMPYKPETYTEIKKRLNPYYEEVVKLNDVLTESASKVFGEEFEVLVTDLTMAVVTLYEDTTPERLLKILREAGYSDEMVTKSFLKTALQEGKNG